MEPKVYTVKEVMAILKISRTTVYRLLDAGKLRRLKELGGVRILAADVDRILASGGAALEGEQSSEDED